MSSKHPTVRQLLAALRDGMTAPTTVGALHVLACRFCAWQEVKAMADLSTRDLIDLMQSGVQGYHDLDDVRACLLTVDLDEGQTTDDWIATEVREFLP